MRFNPASFHDSLIRKFNWSPSKGLAIIYRVHPTTGYRVTFPQQKVNMFVPAWLLHDIEAHGVPLMGIRWAWFPNEVWWRFRKCFHTGDESSIIDHWIGAGGTITELDWRLYIHHRDTFSGKRLFTPTPWVWGYLRACFRYHKRRLCDR